MGLAVVLAVLTLTHEIQVWQVILIAFILGCTSAIDMPTRQAFVIEMVGRRTSATRSPSTRRSSTPPGSSGRRWPGC